MLELAQFRSAGLWRRERCHHRGFGFRCHLSDDVLHASTAAVEDLVECDTGIGREVETISDFRCALPAAFSVCTGAIVDDDLHIWMLAQPVGEYLRTVWPRQARSGSRHHFGNFVR